MCCVSDCHDYVYSFIFLNTFIYWEFQGKIVFAAKTNIKYFFIGHKKINLFFSNVTKDFMLKISGTDYLFFASSKTDLFSMNLATGNLKKTSPPLS